MKKFLAILFSALFVLSFAASAFAIHAEIPAETQATVAKGATQITLGGEIRTRGWYFDNLSSAKIGQDANSMAWYDERVRLSLEAAVVPGVVGFVQLESQSNTDGDKYKWGGGSVNPLTDVPVGGKGSSGVGGSNAKPNTQIDILQAWILYTGQGLLGIPAGIKIGHMPLQLGYGQFFNNTQYGDDAIVFFMDPMKELHVGLLTVKFSEGLTKSNTDDIDGYVGLAVYKIDDKNTAGINYTYVNSTAALGPGTDLKLQDLGIHADGNIAGLGYKVAADFQFGSVFSDAAKTDFSGYAVSLGLNYKIDPVNLRGSFAMGSGDNDATDRKYKEFVAFTGNTQNYSFLYEYNVKTTATGILDSGTPSDGHAAGVANTTYYNLGVDWSATKELGLSLDGYMFRATKTFGSISKTAGWEVDAKMTYAIAKNLNYQVDAGYFGTGNYYRDTAEALGTPIDKKSVTGLRHMLILSF